MYYITVSNGILDSKHREKMQLNQKTSCIWVYLWLLDKLTKIDLETGLGKVLGGKPIKIEEDLKEFGDRKTVMKILKKLEDEGYIKTVRTPYGKSIEVTKAKKSFGWDASKRSPKSGTSDSEESGTSQVNNLVHLQDEKVNNLVHLRSESGTSNKTVQYDNTVRDNTEDNTEISEASASHDIAKIVFSFKEVNPSYEKWYGNKTQRGACERLLKIHGIDRVLEVVSILPQSNKMPYVPSITSPLDLENKWAALESALSKKKAELQAKTKRVIW